MPALQPGSLILVTGGTGYIGTHVVESLLDTGYNVRLVARSESKGAFIRDLFKHKPGKVEVAVVEDITVPGAYDHVAVGVDGAAHLATPVTLTHTGDPNEIIDVAKFGTLNLVEAAHKAGTVSRVVLMSSVTSVGLGGHPPPYRYTEEMWNDDVMKIIEKEGANAPGRAKYGASKVVGERAFWDFIKTNQPKFDGVAILPSFNFGPVIHDVKKFEDIKESSVAFFYPWIAGQKTEADLATPLPNLVDVRDVGKSVALAFSTPQAGGERFIVSHGTLFGEDFAEILRRDFPDFPNVPKATFANDSEGRTGRAAWDDKANIFVGDKVTKVLGLKYRSKDETIKDTAISFTKLFNL